MVHSEYIPFQVQNDSCSTVGNRAFRITCCLQLDLLLQSDSRLKLGVDAGRNDGRGEVSQVGQDTLTQGAHVPLAQLALWRQRQHLRTAEVMESLQKTQRNLLTAEGCSIYIYILKEHFQEGKSLI